MHQIVKIDIGTALGSRRTLKYSRAPLVIKEDGRTDAPLASMTTTTPSQVSRKWTPSLVRVEYFSQDPYRILERVAAATHTKISVEHSESKHTFVLVSADGLVKVEEAIQRLKKLDGLLVSWMVSSPSHRQISHLFSRCRSTLLPKTMQALSPIREVCVSVFTNSPSSTTLPLDVSSWIQILPSITISPSSWSQSPAASIPLPIFSMFPGIFVILVVLRLPRSLKIERRLNLGLNSSLQWSAMPARIAWRNIPSSRVLARQARRLLILPPLGDSQFVDPGCLRRGMRSPPETSLADFQGHGFRAGG